MRILNKYLIQDFMVIFCLTLLIITFVMSVGAVIKAVDFIARGASVWAIVKIFLFNIPFTLTFSIPISVLTSVLLLFSRLSIDGEITAMRACGISLWEIMSPIVMMSVLFSCVCVYLNSSLAPKLHYKMREAIIDIGGVNPVALLETGRWIRDFPGHRIYLGERNGDTFNDISIFKVSDSGVEQSIRAGSGTVKIVTENGKKTLRIDLYDVHGNQNKSGAGDELGGFRSGFSKHIPIDIPMDKLMKRAKSEMKTKERTVVELISAIGDMRAFFPLETVEWLTKKRIRFIVETNKRMALSIACFAFTLLGVPLGITSRRKESSIGIGISILLVFIFYFFIILAESMLDRPRWHPELIIWIPVVLAELGGFALIRRIM